MDPGPHDWRLNERHYGALQGLNKAETAASYGDGAGPVWRRSYDIPPPRSTPTIRATRARDRALRRASPERAPPDRVPEGHRRPLPPRTGTRPSRRRSRPGERVLIAAHGNSLRALVKYLDGISDEDDRRAEHPDRHPAGLRAG